MRRTQRWMKLAAMVLLAFSLGGCGLTLLGRSRVEGVESWQVLSLHMPQALSDGEPILVFYDGDMQLEMRKDGPLLQLPLIQIFSRRIEPEDSP